MSTDQLIRLETLRAICFARGLVKDTDPTELSPGKLGALIGRKTNQVSDLLLGRAKFGEEIARHIEEQLGLPKWELDGGAGWPFPGIQRKRFDDLHRDEKIEIQGLVRKSIEGFEAARAPQADRGTRADAQHHAAAKGKHPPTLQLLATQNGAAAKRKTAPPLPAQPTPSRAEELDRELRKEGKTHDSDNDRRVESQGYNRSSKRPPGKV